MHDGSNKTSFLYENFRLFKHGIQPGESESDLIGACTDTQCHSTNCPPGLMYLDSASAIYVKPYSGPHVLGHLSKENSYELLNEDGKRIFMITNNFKREGSKIYLSSEYENEEFRKFPVHLSVLNHFGDEVFLFYGRRGKILNVGPYDTEPWGKVKRKWGSWIHCTWSGPVAYSVHIGKSARLNGQKESDEVTDYIINGQKDASCFPVDSSKKLYYGGFECKIYPDPDKSTRSEHRAGDPIDFDEPVGEISSNLLCEKLGETLPGAIFYEDLNVYHKCVILGALLVDFMRN